MKLRLSNAISGLVLSSNAPAMAISVETTVPKGEYALTKAECGSQTFVKLAPQRIDFLTYTCKK